MSNRLSRFVENIKASAGNIVASAEKVGRVFQGLDPNESSYYGGYTLKVGREFEMLREIIPTGETYLSPGKIIGFRGNGAIVVIERYSLSEGRYIFEEPSIEEFVEMIKKGDIIGIYEDPNPAEGLDSVNYGGYTLKVGQKFQMCRVIRETGQTYLSPGEIVGFKENGTYVVTERYSRTRGKKIPEEYTIEEFVRKINRGEVTGISKDSNPAEPIDEERVARQKDQRRINEIRRSIRDSIGAEAGVEKPSEETAKIYDNTKGIEVYTTPDGKAIACYTSQYKGETQEDRAVVGAREIGGRVVKLMCAIDGIGGSAHGEFAAQAFAESIQETFDNLEFDNLENLSALSDQDSEPEWRIIENKLIIPAMQQAREKIEAKALEAKKLGDRSYEQSSCVFTVVVIVGNKAYFYTVGDSIGTYFSLRDKTVTPYTTRVNVRIEDGQEYVSGYVGLGQEDIKPLAKEITLEPGGVVVVATDGITDNFRQRGIGAISESIHALLSREEPNEKQGEVTSSEEIAGRILDYVEYLGDNAKKDNQTFMVYYHSGQSQTN